MNWFSKIFGDPDSEHTDSEGQHCYGSSTTSPNYTAPSTSGDVWSDCENDDVDWAIASSLLGQRQNRGNIIDESQLDEDDQLARAIQESLNIESPPRYRDDECSPRGYRNNSSAPEYGKEPPYHSVSFYHPYPTGYRTCAGCNCMIEHGRVISRMNAAWHPECFRCRACDLPISDYEEFSAHSDFPYHKYCDKERYRLKCDICKHFIPADFNGRTEYRAHPFWAQKYCPSHEHDGTPRCCSCERLEVRGTKYVALKDGRELCLECLDSAVMDTNECQPLYEDIQRFYEELDMKVEQDVPLLLVERQALNEAREGENNSHHHMPETRGLCLSEGQSISHCEVTAILILYGLPRLHTGVILAHEMMHAWLRLRGYPTLRPDVEEGICQVLARMWLGSELDGRALKNRKTWRSRFDEKLGDFLRYQIEADASPVYGDGFRAGWRAVRKYGLNRTLDHISASSNFPS